MASHPKVGVGYNAQVASDARHKLIVEQHVTNAGIDLGLLAPTAGAAKEVLGVERIEAVADKGYYQGEDVQACEDVGIEAYIARPQRGSAVRDGLLRSSATTRPATPIAAPADSNSIRSTVASREATRRCSTAIAMHAGAVSSSRNARPIPIGGLAAGPKRRCSTAWRHGWRPDPRF